MSTGGSQWQGFFAAVPLLATLAAAPISFVLLALYRRGVARYMASVAADAPGPPAVAAGATEPPRTLDSTTLHAAALRGPRLTALVYGLAGTVQAAIITILYVRINRLAIGDGVSLLEPFVIYIFLVFAWPVAPTIAQAALPPGRGRLLASLGFLAAILAVSGSKWTQVLLLFLLTMGLPAILVSGVANRKLRVVGPLVLLGTSILFTGLLTAPNLLLAAASRSSMPDLVIRALTLPLLAGIAALVWLGWRALVRLYSGKRISDQSLMLGAWWLLFTVWESVLGLTTVGGAMAALGILAFAGFALVRSAGFGLLRVAIPRGPPARLLLLRTFGGRKRSEHLLEALGMHWRHVGPIQMIAGTDLATGTVDPSQFLDFLAGRLRRQFVTGPADLEQRLATLDLRPDPDGRYRVNQLFCHDDTWRLALTRLAGSSDAVMMDLREFGPQNDGCVFELRQLATLVAPGRVVLLCDESTDRPYLRTILEDAWPPGQAPRVVEQPEARALLDALCAACAARAAPDVPAGS